MGYFQDCNLPTAAIPLFNLNWEEVERLIRGLYVKTDYYYHCLLGHVKGAYIGNCFGNLR
jgi:hypothetical protein